MKRTLCLALAVGLLLMPAARSVFAGEPDPVFQAVPGNAWGMVAIRNLADLDKKLMTLGQETNSPMAGLSMLMMAKGAVGLMSGVNDNAGVALVVMPFESQESLQNSFAVLIPVANYTELLGWMQAQDAGEGISKVLVQGSESYIVQKGEFAILGPSIEAVKAVMQGTGSITANLSEHQLERLAKDDLTAWANAAEIVKSPMVAGLLATAQAIGVQTQGLTELKTLQLNIRIDPDGFVIGFYADVQPGTATAKIYEAMKPASTPLLTGLPADSYVLALGGVTTAEAMAPAVEMLKQSLGQATANAPPEKADATAKAIELATKLIAPLRSMALAANALDEGPDGVVGVTVLLGLEGGSAAFLGSVGELVEVAKSFAPPEEAEKVNAAVTYAAGPEGDHVRHLAVNPVGMGASEEDLAMMKKILGAEGILVRLAAVDEQHVAITIGGGAAYMQNVMTLVKGGQAPLTDDAGIKKVAQAMPAARCSEMFISANGAMKLIGSITKVVGEELPFTLGAVETPVAAYSQYLPGGASQGDLMIPMDLIKAVGQAVMASMGGPGAAPGAGGPPM